MATRSRENLNLTVVKALLTTRETITLTVTLVLTNPVGGRPSCNSSDYLKSDQPFKSKVDPESLIKVLETLLFESFNIKEKCVFTTEIPDSMTSHVITGFSLYLEYGLGLFFYSEVIVQRRSFQSESFSIQFYPHLESFEFCKG